MDDHVLITIKVVSTVAAMLSVVYILVMAAPVFATLLIALFISLAVEPSVKYFQKAVILNKPMPRGASVAVTYILLFLVLSVITSIGLPPILGQAQKFLLGLTDIIGSSPLIEQYNIDLDSLLPGISKISETALDTTLSVFSNFLGFISVFFLSLYISLDWENLKRKFIELFKGKLKRYVDDSVGEIETNVGYWIKGQLILMLVVGLCSFFGLLVLGIDYPLALGLISGLLELVPMIGPIFSAVLASLVGFSVSNGEGIAALILFFLIQQLENNFLVPKVMEKVSGFSPLVVLVAVLVGGNFFGVIGVILAVPITMTLYIILQKVLAYSSSSK
ncbi:AI-2E family transporter [candidate division WWE3 bacterium]|nr:AI-2E family transporter [candidate division WWE3 bacterium]